MVTHSNTGRLVQCLCMAERTGCAAFIGAAHLLGSRSRVPSCLALHEPANDTARPAAVEFTNLDI